MDNPPTELVKAAPTSIVSAEDFMPVFTVEQAIARKQQVNQFIAGVMKDGEDYGKMPGGGREQKVLLKPGAEKLCSIFGLTPRYISELEVEDWTGADHGGEPLFYYKYRCQLYRGDRFMGEALGSSNSWETKHRYRWFSVDQIPFPKTPADALGAKGGKRTLFEFEFALDKRETTGKYGKPAEYWDAFDAAIKGDRARKVSRPTKKGDQWGWEYETDLTLYKFPNPETSDAVNTCQKMGQKRALVAAVLVVTNCSDAFTQDLEDSPEGLAEPPDHQQNTMEQQKVMAERRRSAFEALCRQTAAEPMPSQLQALIDRANNTPAGFKEVLEILRLRYVELLQARGDEVFRGIFDKCRNEGFSKKQTIAELWGKAEEAAANVAAAQQQSLGITDDDLPF